MINATQDIVIKGASEHNLKNINLTIPRGKITVVTGVSGSGKSSLVFDTILAEAQRRFFQTLSYYSRQFLEMSIRPKFHVMKGLSPAIALAQMETQASTRATIGTFSDLAELLGVMFARFGNKSCPRHKLPTESLNEQDMLTMIEEKFSGQLIAVCAPLVEQKKGQFRSKITSLAEKGYLKIFIDGSVQSLTPLPELAKEEKHTLKLIVDSVRIQDSHRQRLARSLHLALTEGEGYVECFILEKNGQLDIKTQTLYSAQGGCSECGYSWPALDSRYFAINSLGRCEDCDGLGVLADEKEKEESVLQRVTKQNCETCRGTGLAERLSAITLAEKTLRDLNLMPIRDLCVFFEGLKKTSTQNEAYKRVLDELIQGAERIAKTGLGYLHLARRVRSLSGGELGRLKLSGVLSETLRGVLYILDEPSQGLHPQEIAELLSNLKALQELGNTIIIVDHDEFLIRHADWVVDLGPGGGAKGGEIVASFVPSEAAQFKDRSATAKYLIEGHQTLALKDKTSHETKSFITLENAKLHNLKIPRVRFQKEAFNVICGVSGSGKTSLVLYTLYPTLMEAASEKKKQGARRFEVSKIELIDRKPLAKSTVSMPVTYLDAFTPIRQLFAQLPEAQMRGVTLRSLSLHADGGRCEPCGGRGEILMSMKFLPDARVRCEYCQGKRYKQDILDILYKGYSIADILNLTIEEACQVFKFNKAILKRLEPARQLGLGYLKLGQPTLSLSGGENQRLKLAPYMSSSQVENNVLILDEPTRGLHAVDIQALLASLRALVERKLTILCIEHNSDIIRAADWIVELGPDSAEDGGQLIFEGDFAALKASKGSKMRMWV
jgi:excinuclease ABC subunit A